MANIALGQVEPQMYAGANDLGGKFLNAWQMGQQVRQRGMALEQNLAEMALKEQQMGYERDFNERKFAWQMKKGDEVNAIREAGMGLREQQLEFQKNKWIESIKQKENALVETQNLNAFMGNCGKQPGEAGYDDCLRQGLYNFPHAEFDQEKLLRTHADAVDKKNKDVDADIKSTLNNFGRDWLHEPKFEDTKPITDWEINTRPAYETEPTEAGLKGGMTKTDPMPREAPEDPNWRFKVDKNGSGILAKGRAVATVDPLDPTQKRFNYVPQDAINNAANALVQANERRKQIGNRGTVTTDLDTPPQRVVTSDDLDKLKPGQRFFIMRNGKMEFGRKN